MTKSITVPGWGREEGIALLHAHKGRATRQGISLFDPSV